MNYNNALEQTNDKCQTKTKIYENTQNKYELMKYI